MTQKPRKSSVDQLINENLKRAYDDVAKEPLPSRFTELLNQLKESTPNDNTGGEGNRSND